MVVKRVMSGNWVLLRLNDVFIMQSVPLGDDSLNRAWWFIMGVITQSFSPQFTTWLPTQHTETHRTDTRRQNESDIPPQWGKKYTQERRDKQAATTHQMVRDSHEEGKLHTDLQKTTASTRSDWWGNWGTGPTLMPTNSRNNFLLLISKGDGELRSWLWELISIKIENEIRAD